MKQLAIVSLGLVLSLACSKAADMSADEEGSGGKGEEGEGGKAPGMGGKGMGGKGMGGATGDGGSQNMGGANGDGGSQGMGGSGQGGNAGSDEKPDAGPGMGGGGGGGVSGGSPAAALDKLLIKVPCPAATTGGSCNIATNVRAYDKPFTIGGTPGTLYKVKLKICAVHEGRPYTMCTASPDSPRICINGMPGTGGFAPTYPTLALKVGDPARTYYLNSGNDYADKILKFDYTATFEMKGGTMVNFISDGGSNGGVYTAYQGGAKYTCPDAPAELVQPYAGQFVWVQVVSVDPMN
jgi:hypothetical protein